MKKKFDLRMYSHPALKKLIMELKIALLLILVGVSNIFAAPGYSQVAKVSVEMNNATLEKVLDKIESQSEFYFVFNQKQIDVNRVVTIQAENKLITDILPELFKGTNVNYAVIDRKILLTTDPIDNNLLALASVHELQQKKVTGTVTDAKTGEPMPGVNVLVEGTTTGVSTDASGKYSITAVNEKSVLLFSFIGYDPIRQTVGGRAIIDVQLVSVAKALDEVVVIGYGTARKADLTSAITTVKADVLANKAVTSLETGLQGIASGVQVTTNSGEPGAGITVRVRGMSSISAGNDPLYVIDGVPFLNDPRSLNIIMYKQSGSQTETAPPNSGMNAINPNDIESIQVLKDASATAIYGNRGANGVILITTKKGKTGQGRITFDMSHGWQTMTRDVGILDSKDYVTYNHESLDYLASLGRTTSTIRLPDTASLVNTDWQKACTVRNAQVDDYNLSFSGGNQNITYFISGNYQKQDGIVPQTGFTRRSLRANIDGKINEKINVGIDMTASFAETDGAYFNEGNIGTQFWSLNPCIRAYNSDGSLNIIDPYPSTGSATNTFVSPIRSKDNPMVSQFITGTFRTIGNIYLSYKILNGLTFRSSYGLDYVNILRQEWIPKDINSVLDGGGAFVSLLKFPSYVWENRLNWDKTINDNVFNVTLAHSMEWHNRFSLMASTENFLDNNLKYNDMSAGSLLHPTQTNAQGWQSVSFIGRINYSFKSKYLASVSLRADASSKFGNHPWGYFPAVSAAWRLSEESFIKDLGFFSDLKLRAGWGSTGNDAIDPFQTLLTYGTTPYVFGGALVTGVKPNLLPYSDLTWEKTYMTSGGLDMSILKDRISLTFEPYFKKTIGLLLNVNIPAVSGFATMLQNVGSIENKGVDISLVTRNVESSNFSWTTKFNFSTNQNTVLKLTGAKDASGKTLNYIDVSIPNSTIRIQEGHALGEFYDYKYGGVFKDAAEVASQPGKNVGPGNEKLMDLSGPKGVPDSIINNYDKTWVGNPNPKFILGIENQLSYKGFTLGFFINSVYGNTIKVANYFSPTKGPLLTKYFKERWTPTNTNTSIPRAGSIVPTRTDNGAQNPGDLYWDGSFVRLQSLTLSYDIPPRALEKAKVHGLRLYVTVKNLFLISSYGGYDPEVNSGGNYALQQGFDANGYPSFRTWLIGVNLTL